MDNGRQDNNVFPVTWVLCCTVRKKYVPVETSQAEESQRARGVIGQNYPWGGRSRENKIFRGETLRSGTRVYNPVPLAPYNGAVRVLAFAHHRM